MEINIRRFKYSDKDDMYNNITSDEENSKYMLFRIHKTNEDIENGINHFVENENIYAIEYNKEVIGWFTYTINKRHRFCDISYILGNKYHNKGIMSYVLNYFINKAKEDNVNLVIAEVMEENIASSKLLEKNNFKLDGVIRNKYIGRDKEYHNIKIYTLLI